MERSTDKIGYWSAFLLPALVVGGFYLDGAWNILPLAFGFVLLPVMDHLLGIDASNVPSEERDARSHERYYRFVTYAWTYVQLIFLVWCAIAVSSGRLDSAGEWAAFVTGCALVTGGIGITVAHELGHKKSSIQKLYAKALLMTVFYMHFTIEHNRGHHVTVGTPADPATARKNEDFYRFWIRSVFGGYKHAWTLEVDSLKRKGKRLVSFSNNLLWFAILPVCFGTLLTVVAFLWHGEWSWQVPWFFGVQSVLAFTLLELVNYVEHYAIRRKEIVPGKYEKINPAHAWNASHKLSNFFLFQLQRHSDHHLFAHKPYQVLDHHDESPQLPFGYPTMIMIALIPPLWFAMMNKRYESWERAVEMGSPGRAL